MLICHWIPPVVGSVCWAMTWAAWLLTLLAADMVRPWGKWTGDGDESGDDVIDITWGIWISCLMCNCDVYMADWLLLPLMLVELAIVEMPPG